MSGRIEMEMSKVIIALSTNNEEIDIFEGTITGRFSCINTRFDFETVTLMLNISHAQI